MPTPVWLPPMMLMTTPLSSALVVVAWLCVAASSLPLVKLIAAVNAGGGGIPYWLWGLMVCVTVLGASVNKTMFVAQMCATKAASANVGFVACSSGIGAVARTRKKDKLPRRVMDSNCNSFCMALVHYRCMYIHLLRVYLHFPPLIRFTSR